MNFTLILQLTIGAEVRGSFRTSADSVPTPTPRALMEIDWRGSSNHNNHDYEIYLLHDNQCIFTILPAVLWRTVQHPEGQHQTGQYHLDKCHFRLGQQEVNLVRDPSVTHMLHILVLTTVRKLGIIVQTLHHYTDSIFQLGFPTTPWKTEWILATSQSASLWYLHFGWVHLKCFYYFLQIITNTR